MNASSPSRKAQDREDLCAGIGEEAHHLFPSLRMAKSQETVPWFDSWPIRTSELLLFWLRLWATTRLVPPRMEGRMCAECQSKIHGKSCDERQQKGQ